MSLDEMYDEMLRAEFSSAGQARRGRHGDAVSSCATHAAQREAHADSRRVRGAGAPAAPEAPRRARGRGGSRATATPPWWGPAGWPAPRWAPFSAASVAYFTINPAAAHPLGVVDLTGPIAAAAANQAARRRVVGGRHGGAS